MKGVIAVDVDEVVLKLLPNWINFYNRDFGQNLDWRTIDDWDTSKFVVPEARESIFEYVRHSDVFSSAEPVLGAFEGVQTLRSLGWRVIFVTANNPDNVKMDWLEKHGFLDSDKDFVQAYDKSLILADFLFDDRYENCRDFNGIGILKNMPYNKRYHWLDRVDDWSDFLEWFK